MGRNILPVILGLLLASLVFNVYLFSDFMSKKSTKLARPVPNSSYYKGISNLSDDSPEVEVSEAFGSSSRIGISTYDRVQIQKRFEELSNTVGEMDGIYSVYVKDLGIGFHLSFNKSHKHNGASLYKIPVAVATLASVEDESLQLDEWLVYEEEDYSEGTGEIKNSEYDTAYTVGDLLNRLIKDSDNVAQNLLLKAVSFSDIAKLFPNSSEDRKFPVVLEVTAEEMVNILEDLYKENLLSSENTSKLLDIMSSTSFDDRINEGLSDGIEFAHKIGNDPDGQAWHDCGIATKDERAVIVCVMSSRADYEDFLVASKMVGEFISFLFEY